MRVQGLGLRVQGLGFRDLLGMHGGPWLVISGVRSPPNVRDDYSHSTYNPTPNIPGYRAGSEPWALRSCSRALSTRPASTVSVLEVHQCFMALYFVFECCWFGSGFGMVEDSSLVL